MVASLSAQSVTISPTKLDELIQILLDYEQITDKLQQSLDNSETRINDLESGFGQYKKTVEEELLPRALALERKVVVLQVGFVVTAILAGGFGLALLIR